MAEASNERLFVVDDAMIERLLRGDPDYAQPLDEAADVANPDGQNDLPLQAQPDAVGIADGTSDNVIADNASQHHVRSGEQTEIVSSPAVDTAREPAPIVAEPVREEAVETPAVAGVAETQLPETHETQAETLATEMTPGESLEKSLEVFEQPPAMRRVVRKRPEGGPAYSGAFARAVSLASRGRLEQAIAVLDQAVEDGEGNAEVHCGLGHLRFEQEKWSEASAAYGAVADAEPGHPTARYNRALCLERQGSFTQAAEEFAQAAEHDPEHWQAKLGEGLCLMRVGNPEIALAAIEKAGQQMPQQVRKQNNFLLAFASAVAMHKCGRLEDAQLLYQQLLAQRPDSPELLANLISVSLSRGEKENVEEWASRLADLDPNAIQVSEGRAAAAFARADAAGAAEQCAHLVKALPHSYEAWFNLGVANQQSDHPEEAALAYHEALKLKPEAVQANVNLGVVLQKINDWAGARAALEAAAAVEPDHPGILWNLALIADHDAEHAADQDNAEKRLFDLLSRLITIKPDWEDAQFRLGSLHMKRGQFEAAIGRFEQCLAKRKDWADAAVNLGLASWKAGDLDAAMITLHKALEMDPDNIDGIRAMTAVAMERNEVSLAKGFYSKLRSHGQQIPELAFNLGLLLQSSGDSNAALEYYAEAVEWKPDFAVALLNLGHALESVGDHNRARQMWSKAVEADPQLAEGYFV